MVLVGHQALAQEWLLIVASVAIAGFGIWVAIQFYLKKPETTDKLVASWPRLHRLVYRKYYVDEIYDAMFVNRTKDLGTALSVFDANVVDGLGVDGAGWLTRMSSRLSIWWDKWIVDGLVNVLGRAVQVFSYPVRLVQTGVVSSYALLIVLGMVLLLSYYVHEVRHLIVR